MLLRSGLRLGMRPRSLNYVSPVSWGDIRARAAARYKIRRFIARNIRRRRLAARKRFAGRVGGALGAGALLAGTPTTRRGRRNVGHRVGASNCKRRLILQGGWQAYPKATLNQTNLTQIGAVGTTPGDLDNRQRNLVNLRGFRFDFELRNKLVYACYCNIAVVSPKDNDSIIDNDFFRANGSDERAINFTDGRAESAVFMHMAAINTDKYNVLMHHRFTLGGRQDGSGGSDPAFQSSGTLTSYRRYHKYLPVNRQIRFDNNTSIQPESGNCYLIWWFNRMGESATIVPETPANTCDFGVRAVTYFRDSAN